MRRRNNYFIILSLTTEEKLKMFCYVLKKVIVFFRLLQHYLSRDILNEVFDTNVHQPISRHCFYYSRSPRGKGCTGY